MRVLDWLREGRAKVPTVTTPKNPTATTVGNWLGKHFGIGTAKSVPGSSNPYSGRQMKYLPSVKAKIKAKKVWESLPSFLAQHGYRLDHDGYVFGKREADDLLRKWAKGEIGIAVTLSASSGQLFINIYGPKKAKRTSLPLYD